MEHFNNFSDTKRKWRLSTYTQVVGSSSGELLLHNSFMGAVARIPVHKFGSLETFLTSEYEDSDLVDESLLELCDAGFFIPADINERSIVDEIITKERDSGFQIIILPHEQCNFRCVYCYEKFERGKMKPDVVEGLKAFVAGKANDVERLSISWFGGEPLLACNLIYDLSDSFLALST